MAKGNSDLELLIKMMGLTGSDNDNQALVAMRKANEQVKKLAGSWAELLRGHFTIAADPFEGISMPEFGDRAAAPPPPSFRRGVHSGSTTSTAPPPPPWKTHTPPPPQSPPPKPNLNTGASGPMGTSSTPRTNRWRAVCFKCHQWCDVGDGYLDHKDAISNTWKVRCIDDTGCAARAKKASNKSRKSSAARSADNLTNML